MRRCLMSIVLLAAAGCAAPDTTGAASGDPSPAASPSPSSDASPSSEASPSPEASPEDSNVSEGNLLSGSEAAGEADIDPAGAVAGVEFRDRNGVNVLVLRQEQKDADVSLRADLVALFPMTEERDVLREVRDGVQDCEADVSGEFLTESLEVRDSDQDDEGEVMFAYRLGCRNDVSAAEQKLLLLEGREKYILRGTTSTPYDEYAPPEPEPAPDEWPEGSYEWAQTRFRELAPEFDGPVPSA